MNIYENINYKSPIRYSLNTYIREYDLSKANINALLYHGRISQDEYNTLYNSDKSYREKYIGLLIRKDKSIYEDINKGIIFAKKQLFSANDIQDYEVISIKNDAVYVSGRMLKYTSFPPFEFMVKNTYTIFMKLQDLEIYYSDSIGLDGSISTNIDVKGISDTLLPLHQYGMLDIICEAGYRIQRENSIDTLKWLSDIYQKYINRQLPKEYYRNFDAFSMYSVNTLSMSTMLPDIDNEFVNSIDINRNLAILRDLIWIISDKIR